MSRTLLRAMATSVPTTVTAVLVTAFTLATAATGTADTRATAGPEMTAHPATDLTDGTKITVTATGYRPGLQSVAVGLCREGYQNGLKDCDLGGGATFVNVDAHGRLPTVVLTARAKFNGIDCMVRQCVIGAAPLPGAMPHAIVAANTAVMKVGFKGSAFKGGDVADAPDAATPALRGSGDGPSTLLWTVTLGTLVLGGFTIAVVQRRRPATPGRRPQVVDPRRSTTGEDRS